MDSEAARRDDVVPTDWGHRDSVVSVFEARRSSSIEYLHFYIESKRKSLLDTTASGAAQSEIS